MKNKTRFIQTVIMIAIYLAMFILVVFTPVFDNLFARFPTLRWPFGLLFLVYGLFRAYRLWRSTKE